MQADTLYYVIEHFETEFSNWTLSEYVHMLLIVCNIYGTKQTTAPNGLILTNFNFSARCARGTLEEDDLNTKANTQRFDKIRANLAGKCLVTELSFEQVTAAEAPAGDFKDDTL